MANENNSSCRFEHDAVSYLYGELAASERVRFEAHLESCGECVDLFAGLSEARFSVFEWQREEFAPMETPPIQIPWHRPETERVTAGWFSGLVELFTIVRSPLAMATGVLVLLGVGIGSFVLLNGETEVASNRVPAIVEIEPEAAVPVVTPEIAKDSEPRETEKAPAPQAVKTVDGPRRVTRPASVRSATPAPRPRTAPVLSEFKEVEDRSLRLADMLDDIGG